MSTGRVEAFSDGVMAIIITIMAFGIEPPIGTDLEALGEVVPSLLVFALSFAPIGTYWNNHHHLLSAAKKITPAVMWANLHLLFWLCLVPVVTAWVADHYEESLPAASYAAVCLLAGAAYWLLTRAIIGANGRDSDFARAIGSDLKGNVSVVAYSAAFVLAFLSPFACYAICLAVALMWIIPDRRLREVS